MAKLILILLSYALVCLIIFQPKIHLVKKSSHIYFFLTFRTQYFKLVCYYSKMSELSHLF